MRSHSFSTRCGDFCVWWPRPAAPALVPRLESVPCINTWETVVAMLPAASWTQILRRRASISQERGSDRPDSRRHSVVCRFRIVSGINRDATRPRVTLTLQNTMTDRAGTYESSYKLGFPYVLVEMDHFSVLPIPSPWRYFSLQVCPDLKTRRNGCPPRPEKHQQF